MSEKTWRPDDTGRYPDEPPPSNRETEFYRRGLAQGAIQAGLTRLDLAKAFALEIVGRLGHLNATALARDNAVREGVALADALLAELAKPKEEKP